MTIALPSPRSRLSGIADELQRLSEEGEGGLQSRLSDLAAALRDVAEAEAASLPAAPDVDFPSIGESSAYMDMGRFGESAPGCFFTVVRTPDGRWGMPFASKGFQDAMGIPAEAVKESIRPMVKLTVAEDLEKVMSAAEASGRDLIPYHAEYRIEHPQKGERWIECRSLPREEADGSVCWHGFMHDITQRKTIENLLHFIARRDSTTDAEHFSVGLAKELARLLYGDYVIIGRLIADGSLVESTVYLVHGTQVANVTYSLEGTPCEKAVEQDFSCYPKDLQGHFPGRRLLAEMNAHSHAGISLKDSRGETIGIMCILSSSLMTDVSLVKAVLQAAAPAAAAAIERAQSDRELQRQEHQFRSLAENMPDYVARWDVSGNYLYINPALERLFGIPAQAMLGKPVVSTAEMVGDKSDTHAATGLSDMIQQVVAAGEERNYRQRLCTPQGDEQIHDIRLLPERDENGQVISVLSIGRDVTEQVRLQEALEASEKKFRSLTEHMPDNVVRWDLDGRHLYVNPVMEETIGQPASAIIGTLISPYYSKIIETHAQIIATGEGASCLQPLTRSDGTEAVHEVSIIPEWGPDGKMVSLLGIGRDVTHHIRMQEALVASEQQFRSLAENMPDNVARWDAQGRYIYINPTHERTLGLRMEEAVGTFLPDSHGDVWSAFKHLRMTGENTVRVHQEGDFGVHEVSIIAERDADGNIVSYLGIGRDMTEWVRMQQAMAASEWRFRSLAENLPNKVFRYDVEGRILYMNPAAEKILGQRLEQLIGTRPSDRPQFPFYPEYEKRLADAARGISSEMEIIFQQANGEEVCDLQQFSPERDDEGHITSVLSISHDITTRKRAEVDLRMAASVFNAANEAIVITDPHGHMLRANPAFSRITGYPQKAARNVLPMLFRRSRQHGDLHGAMLRSLAAQGSWSGEMEATRQGGETFTARLSVSAAHDSDGAVLYYVAIFSDISQLKQHELQLEYIAHHDTLTGLPNRVLLIDRMQQAIAQARRDGTSLAVLFIDLDGFKPINDRFGHQTGDHTLVEMARRMTDVLRAGDTVARLGGDEFIVLLPGLRHAKECEHTTRRLLNAIADPLDVEGSRFTLSASIGIALYPDDADDADSLLRYADETMYIAKRTGRNQYVFSNSNGQGFGNRLDGNLVHELRVALEHDQIEVHYQPIVDLSTGKITKAEALVRWRHPQRGLVPPSEFIPMAEESGLIHAIGTRVFGKAVEVALQWNRDALPGPLRRISVNRSPREFLDPTGIEDWMNILHKHPRDLGRMLTVEITEGLLLDDRSTVLSQLKQLRATGMTIALDDFGTGFSSLAYLKKFDIDYIKIDRSFVLDIVHDTSDWVIVGSVIAMGRHLGIRLIAEGVETDDQASLLAGMECHYAQGYLYARPMPADQFLEFVSRVEAEPLHIPHLLEKQRQVPASGSEVAHRLP